jgi:hypothetical protein
MNVACELSMTAVAVGMPAEQKENSKTLATEHCTPFGFNVFFCFSAREDLLARGLIDLFIYFLILFIVTAAKNEIKTASFAFGLR